MGLLCTQSSAKVVDLGPVNVLALDTATPYLVLGTLDAERVLHRGRRHAETLLDDLEAFLAHAGLERRAIELIVVGEGPGSYTGLRVGLSTALGLARGLGVPVVGAASLAAAAARGRGRVRALLSARNRQVYAADYLVADDVVETAPPRKLSAEEALAAGGCLLWNAPPSGRALARLGAARWRQGREGVHPLYL